INRIYGGFTADHVEQLRDAVLDLYDTMKLTAPIAIVQFASWCSVAEVLPGCTVVYDCLDLLSGFENIGQQALADEQRLIRSADLLVTTSQPLADRIAPVRASALIRNGAMIEHFRSARRKRSGKDQPVVGYFGAIDHWFEASWVRAAAEHNPAVHFKLIGRAEPEIVAALDGLSNVERVDPEQQFNDSGHPRPDTHHLELDHQCQRPNPHLWRSRPGRHRRDAGRSH